MNKTVIQSKSRNESPEKVKKDFKRKTPLLEDSETLRKVVSHKKNVSNISSTIESFKTPRKNSQLSPKIIDRKGARTHHESLPHKDKENINIKEESANKTEINREEPKNKETEKISNEEIFNINYNSISKFLGINDLPSLMLNKNFLKLTIKSIISQKKDEMIQNEKNIQILREV